MSSVPKIVRTLRNNCQSGNYITKFCLFCFSLRLSFSVFVFCCFYAMCVYTYVLCVLFFVYCYRFRVYLFARSFAFVFSSLLINQFLVSFCVLFWFLNFYLSLTLFLLMSSCQAVKLFLSHSDIENKKLFIHIFGKFGHCAYAEYCVMFEIRTMGLFNVNFTPTYLCFLKSVLCSTGPPNIHIVLSIYIIFVDQVLFLFILFAFYFVFCFKTWCLNVVDIVSLLYSLY